MSVYQPPYSPYAAASDPCERAADAARAAGFPSWLVPVVVAIARAESGCRPEATCASCAGAREYSVGPWQINLLAHPWVSEDCARDPYCAAKAVFRISGGGSNLFPWSTYASGAYRRYLDPSQAAAGGLQALGAALGSGEGGRYHPVSNPQVTRVVIIGLVAVLLIYAVGRLRKR